jgi:hypothetical protein
MHERANKPMYNPIKAELVVQGDPLFDTPATIYGKRVHIIVINPFRIENSGGGGSKDWVIRPQACNEVLSNNNWLAEGVHHSMKDGQFITTLRVFLSAPGVNHTEQTLPDTNITVSGPG